MAIEGPLRELGIHAVFQLLDLSRKTGTLRITSPERNNEGSVYFDAGTIVAATMKSNPHLLGTILERSGKATPADLARATALQRASDTRKVGDVWVAQGSVTRGGPYRLLPQPDGAGGCGLAPVVRLPVGTRMVWLRGGHSRVARTVGRR